MRIPHLLGLVVGAVSLCALSGTALAEDTWTDAFPGVRHLHRVTATPNQNIHVAKIDLCAAGVSFRATKFEERGKKTSAFGAAMGAQIAVNGDFFKANFGLERGIGVGAGVAWPVDTPEDSSVGQLAIGASRVDVIADSVLQSVKPWMQEVVGGRPSLLKNGALADTSGHPSLCERNPRTAVGLSQDKRTLLLAVVDGRNTRRVGMTCGELASLMKGLGAYNALNFDGGGSTTMWFSTDGVLNNPTDGTGERTVGSHLAVYASGTGPAAACPPPSSAQLADGEGDAETSQEALVSSGGPVFGAENGGAEDTSDGCSMPGSPLRTTDLGLVVGGLAFAALCRRWRARRALENVGRQA